MYNLGDKAVDEFAKLSTIGFSIEYFTTGFLVFHQKTSNFGFGLTG